MIRKYIPEPIKEVCRRMRAKLLSIGLSRLANFEQPHEEILASSDISVIIAIHDSPQVTRRCLDNIERYSGNAQIILVDDGSQLQETIDLIRDYQERNDWRVVKHNKPLGHSRACEHGGMFSKRKYICFLNSDAIITPWSWSGAVEAFAADSKIAVVGPSTSWTATPQKIRRAEYCRHYWDDWQIISFAKKYITKQPPRCWVQLPFVGGFAFFVRRKIWIEYGGFDENLPDYGNEVVFCKRVLRDGYQVVWTKNSYIHHLGQSSYGKRYSLDEIKKIGIWVENYIDNK